MENDYAEEAQFLSDKAEEKSRFRELSTKETEKNENAIPTATKKPQMWDWNCLMVRISEVSLTSIKKLTNT